jgi:signal transduction histidine kinase
MSEALSLLPLPPASRILARCVTWLPWAIGAIVLGLMPPVLALAFVNRDSPDVWLVADPTLLASAVAYGAVGVLLAVRRPRHPIGWLCLATALLTQLSSLAAHWAVYGLVTRPGVPGAALALRLSLVLAAAALTPVPTFLLLLFPTGRLPDRWTRAVAWVSGVAGVMLPLALLTGGDYPPGSSDLFAETANPLALPVPLGDAGVGIFTLVLCGLVAAALLLMRFRATRAEARQQYLWVVLALALVSVTFLADTIARLFGNRAYLVTGPAQSFANILVPVAMGIAILRYRLWDIEIIVSRALVYLALSACVVGIYVFVVGWLATVFRTGGNLVFSLVATGIVAVLFQPLRARIQRAVNRLVYGERDEPYAVISRLGRRLEEAFAPDAVLPTIAGTVREALKLPYAAITLRQEGTVVVAAASGDPAPDPVRLPLVYQQEPVGELLLAPRAPGEAFGVADRRLLDDLARQAGVAVHAVRLTHDLQRARERLVATREEERRRLRRDLHDGLGSQLVALNLQAGALRGLIAGDAEAALAEVAELRTQLRAAITSIRGLVRGLGPPVIDELGLLTALRERARQYQVDGLVVEVDFPSVLPTLPAAVEVAIYRIVEEALTNVAKHARARWCAVRLRAGEALDLSVEDDGVGMPAEAGAGVGLHSMRERAAELGGDCRIEPRPGGGTRVAVRLPLSYGAGGDTGVTAEVQAPKTEG